MTEKRPRPLEETHPHLKEFTAFLDSLNKESDRGAVLIAAAMLDDLLGKSVRAFLIDHKEVENLLEGFNAPLGTLSSRALAAFSLGVISEREYRECDRLRKVRNIFAHNVHSAFKDQKVKEICANLEFSAKGPPEAPVDAKGQYTTAAVGLILGLTNRPHYVALRRLKYGDWKY
ncbi:MAG TPA: MltR family transcriptional regulator [Terracidiphilus sp.]|nr:MltR family transcriptional regulator [Terracidiphilus sp.]